MDRTYARIVAGNEPAPPMTWEEYQHEGEQEALEFAMRESLKEEEVTILFNAVNA